MTARNSNRQREVALSVLNIIFCFLVMFIHVSSEPVMQLDRGTWQAAGLTFFWRCASFVVPGFLFLSGLKLFLRPERVPSSPRGYLSYICRRYETILRPYLFAVLIYYCFFAAVPYYSYRLSLSDYIRYVVVGDLVSHFYYIVILVQFTLLLPLWTMLVRHVRARYVIPSAFLVTLVFAFLPGRFTGFAYYDRVFPTYLVYWLVGCYCGAHWDKVRKFCSGGRRFIIYAITAAAIIADPLLYTLKTAGTVTFPTSFTAIHVLYCLAAVAGIFVVSIRLFGQVSALPRPLDAFDRASYDVYLWHCLVIYIVNLFMTDRVESIGARYEIRAAVVMLGTPVLCIFYRFLRSRIIKWANMREVPIEKSR